MRQSILGYRKRIDAENDILAIPSGSTVADACRLWGVGVETARRRIKSAGHVIVRSGRRFGPQRVAWYDVDWSQQDAEIARQLSVTRQAVGLARRRFGRFHPVFI